jgi:carbamoyltransferase
MIYYAKKLSVMTRSKNLCISGGAGLNCVANTKIKQEGGFKHLFVQPGSTDDGNAIGAAMYGWHAISKRKERFYLTNAYLGRKYSRSEIIRTLVEHGLSAQPLSKKHLLLKTAKLISQGKIVGWFQGESEFGPRALGHRSILAHPGIAGMKSLLNRKVKHREGFRPYAPSILAEKAAQYFDLDCPSPFMLLVAKIKPSVASIAQETTHIDGTARIQTVTKKENGIFYELIKEFYRITGIPLVLNTSFNLRGEPIVETPSEALRVFITSKMDALVLENYLLGKK